MAFTIPDLKLTLDKITQIEKALGGVADVSDPENPVAEKLQGICDEAAADVARLTTGYVLDAVSVTNFTRSLALFRAYGYIGPIPKDVDRNHDDAMKELTAIAAGDRPNLPKVKTTSQNTISGGWGSNKKIPGRMD